MEVDRDWEDGPWEVGHTTPEDETKDKEFSVSVEAPPSLSPRHQRADIRGHTLTHEYACTPTTPTQTHTWCTSM